MHAVAHVLWVLFNWPDGIVVGNLIASAIWAPTAFLHLHRKINRHHRELKGERDAGEDPQGRR